MCLRFVAYSTCSCGRLQICVHTGSAEVNVNEDYVYHMHILQ